MGLSSSLEDGFTSCEASTLRVPMYLSHFKLEEKPFKASTDPKFLWLGEKQKEALETLRHGILYGDGYVVLTGDVGTGKTTLALALVNDLRDQCVTARIPHPDVDILDFLRLISTAYGIDSDFPSKASFRDRFESFLRSRFSTGGKAVLIIDEAQRLRQEHLGELIQLSSFEENGVGLFNIVFVGQNEFNDILLEESNRPLRQRTTVNCHLTPLTRTETEQYIFHRLDVVNGQREMFTSEAVQEVFVQSGGIPRVINSFCDLALLMTYLEGGSKVRAEAVKKGVERYRLPGERPEFIAAGTKHSRTTEDKIGGEITTEKAGPIRQEVRREDAPKTVRGKFLWAGGFALVIVMIGFALLFFHRGEQHGKSEASIEKVSQEGSTNQSEMKPSIEEEVGGTVASSSNEPSLLQGTDRVSDSSAQGKTASRLPGTKPSSKASIEGPRTKSGKALGPLTSVVPSRKPFPELLREEKTSREREAGFDERRIPPLENGQERKAQNLISRTGPSVRDTPEKETEEVEPGRVIDWLLEKRGRVEHSSGK